MDNRETGIELRIDSLAYGGSGVGRLPEGKVVFVPLTAPGDVIHFRTIREKKGYIEGEVVELVSPSPLRQVAPCPVFGKCGGCIWQHLPYEQQLREKESIFRETLWRLGTVERERIGAVVPSPEALNYRNRAQFKASYAEGRLHLGFYRRKSHFVIDIDGCPLVSPLINRLIDRLKPIIADAPFRDRMPQVDIAVDDRDERATAIIHLVARPGEKDYAFAKKRIREVPELKGLFFQSGRKNTLSPIYIQGKGKLSYNLPIQGKNKALELLFAPGGFTQVNYSQNRALISHVLGLVKGRKAGRVLDLFCGIGNFSLPIAALAGEVVGVEDYGPAIEDARGNAMSAGIANTNFITGDARQFVKKENLDRFDLACQS